MQGAVRCAAIVAGGASRRMGQDKALMHVGAETMIARLAKVLSPLFEKIIVVTSSAEIALSANLPAIPDAVANKGPLGGIHAALKYFQEPTFCVACDLPFLNSEVIAFLCARFDADCDVVTPRINERMETLLAIYAPSCQPVLEQAFKSEKMPGAEKVLSPLRLCFVDEATLRRLDPELQFLTNLNSPDDVARAGIGVCSNSV